MTLAFGAGALLVGAAVALYTWFTASDSEKESERYYHLPPRDGPTAATAPSGSCCDASPSLEADGGHPCVCCLENPQTFMFVQCHHICLCEACLIQLGRTYEDNVLKGRFSGPVRVPCPVCRTMGYVTRTYAS
ncbi:Zinc finger, C3HC4 type (RING finger) containing protein [Novymonas esmeraldas]|uniref:Zinc finger, C3HC4 type (RING finger) containing protein n=1 Tax=Novymonas esmeraldas TaxID=1808958 RepID=A0AAW0F0R1_9TRYP